MDRSSSLASAAVGSPDGRCPEVAFGRVFSIAARRRDVETPSLAASVLSDALDAAPPGAAAVVPPAAVAAWSAPQPVTASRAVALIAAAVCLSRCRMVVLPSFVVGSSVGGVCGSGLGGA